MSWRDRAKPSSVKGDGDRPSLESVLDHYGVEYPHKARTMVHCPLHEDNTSSCSIDTDKQLWKCHSCGNGGDSWELIKKKEDTDFEGARRFATTVGLAAGGAGGSGKQLRGGPRNRRGGVSSSAQSRGSAGDGGYVPSWRRS